MQIKGIDLDRCSFCKSCIRVCVLGNFSGLEKEKKVIFDSTQNCILCGHCIAACPENAILSQDLNIKVPEFEDPKEIISYPEIHKLMCLKRSIRQYQNKKIPEEIIEKIIDCMKYAPIALNKRTLKCLVVSSEQKINEFIDSIIQALDSEEEREEYHKKREIGVDPFFYNAPHILILHSNNAWDSTNAPIVITYAMLCAETLGLGSCWIGGVERFLKEKKDVIKNVFGINDDIFGIMILGYPKVKYYRAPPRPPIETNFISETSD